MQQAAVDLLVGAVGAAQDEGADGQGALPDAQRRADRAALGRGQPQAPLALAPALGLRADLLQVARDARGVGVHRAMLVGPRERLRSRPVRVVLQRVRWARVAVGEEVVGAIGPGLLALVGVAAGDEADDARLLARKTVRLRVLAGEDRPFDRCAARRPRRRPAVREPVHAARRRPPGGTAPRGRPPRRPRSPSPWSRPTPPRSRRRASRSSAGASAPRWRSAWRTTARSRSCSTAPTCGRPARQPAEEAPRPKGLPSVSRQMAQRSPGWITSPPSATTRSRAPGRSSTAK